ncbi:MAG: hypothetical protein AUI13_07550 [Gemmatimonadetes bacterium 13_2_20CM_2_69_23]|nr:MAG: hypothetical protein AUI13_07550 [Gemmatimonadetes bacterium 13_2_20CM_2_69_23]
MNEFLGGWSADSVIVDNHALQHLLLPDVGIYCPPLTVGKCVPLPSLGRVRAQFASPPGVLPPVQLNPAQVATLTCFAEALAPHPGVPDGIQTSSQLQDEYLFGTGIGTVSTVQRLITLPAGASLKLYIAPLGSTTTVQYSVDGMVTGKNYYGTPGLQSEPVGKPLVVSGFDLADQVTNGLQLTMITGALGTGQQISAYAVLPNLVNPGPTIGQPAPWQAGIFSVGDSGFNLGVGASKTLVAASQAVLYVHAVHFWTDAAGAVLVQLQDDASTPDLVMTGRAPGAGSCLGPINLGGRRMGIGRAIVFKNLAGVGANFYPALTYNRG